METIEVSYNDYRNKIKAGDLLAWDKGSGGWFSSFIIFFIQLMTRSKFGHVGVAWKTGGRLFVVEATTPHVRITPVSNIKSFYHIPMHLRWLKIYDDNLLDKIGLNYSIADCIRAYFGKPSSDNNRYQCAELACDFYRSIGIDLGSCYQPGLLVNAALLKRNSNIVLVCK